MTCAALIYWASNLYQSKWRFASIPDLVNIVRAASFLALGFLVVDYILLSPQVLGQFYFGKNRLTQRDGFVAIADAARVEQMLRAAADKAATRTRQAAS